MCIRAELQGQLHRPRYQAGEPLKAFVSVRAVDVIYPSTAGSSSAPTPSALPSAKTEISVPLQRSPSRSLLSMCAPSPVSLETADLPAIQVSSLTAQVVGLCVIDGTRLNTPADLAADVLPREDDHRPFQDAGANNGESFVARWLGWGRKGSREGTSMMPGGGPSTTGMSLTPSPSSSALDADGHATLPIVASPLTTTAVGMGSSADVPVKIFASPVIELVSSSSNEGLRNGESLTGLFVCELPGGLPPSYGGRCLRYAYMVFVTCTWHATGRAPQTTTLRVPVVLDSNVAAAVTLLRPYIPASFDCACRHTTIARRIGDGCNAFPHLAPPTSNRLFVSDPEPAAHVLASGLQPAKGPDGEQVGADLSGERVRRPYEVAVPLPRGVDEKLNDNTQLSADAAQAFAPRVIQRNDAGDVIGCIPTSDRPLDAFPVRIVLADTLFSLDDSLCGVILATPVSLSTRRAMVCFRVTAAIEGFESAPRNLFRAGSVIPRTPGEAQLHEEAMAVAHCVESSEREYYLPIGGGQVPLEIPLTHGRFEQTLHTDLVTLSWRLRMTLFFVSAADALKVSTTGSPASASGVPPRVPLFERLQEVIIPLTIISPKTLQRPRLGPVFSSQ